MDAAATRQKLIRRSGLSAGKEIGQDVTCWCGRPMSNSWHIATNSTEPCAFGIPPRFRCAAEIDLMPYQDRRRAPLFFLLVINSCSSTGHPPCAALRFSSNDARDIVRLRPRVGRLVRTRHPGNTDLLLEVAAHRLCPAIGAGDPGGGAGIDTAIQRFVALAQLLPFEPAEAAPRRIRPNSSHARTAAPTGAAGRFRPDRQDRGGADSSVPPIPPG